MILLTLWSMAMFILVCLATIEGSSGVCIELVDFGGLSPQTFSRGDIQMKVMTVSFTCRASGG